MFGWQRVLCYFVSYILNVSLVHYLRDPQISFLVKFSLKIGLTALFTHLKIILLQYFQFSTINDIQTDPKLLLLFFFNDD